MTRLKFVGRNMVCNDIFAILLTYTVVHDSKSRTLKEIDVLMTFQEIQIFQILKKQKLILARVFENKK